jgi:MinD-like ATPase involved in chromosome partitioning or flagellar assembly/ActR/RegA family two-component response regulator
LKIDIKKVLMNTTPICVLVIDGDEASRNYLTVMLTNNGYIVMSASLGREGLITAWKDKPDIIVLDPLLPDLKGVELVTRLRQDRRTTSVPCIALSGQQDSEDMNSLLAAGCNEYIVKSNQTLTRLMDILPRLLQGEPPAPKKRGMLIVFLSAKGGIGTSSLCANIAMCLGSEKIETRVAVIDMVLPIGSISDIVGYTDRMNLVSVALENPTKTSADYFKDNLPRVPSWYFHLLAGSPDPESANNLVVSRLDGLINGIIESYDYILVDMGRALSQISLPIIKMADVIVLMVGSDLSSAILTQKIWDFLMKQGIDSKRVYPLQNRAVGLEGMTRVELEQKTRIQIRNTMPYLDGNFTIANNRHEPIISKFPDDSSSITLKEVALQIANMGHQSHG